jgi:hypothetical protein
MSYDPGDPTGGSRRRPPTGAQGASRGGFQPDDSPDDGDPRSTNRGHAPDDLPWNSGRAQSGRSPFGDNPFGGRGSGWGRQRSSGWSSYFDGTGARFLGLPVGLIYAFGAALFGIVLFSTMCGRPTATGSVAGQIKALSADRTVSTLAGAQVTLNGGGKTFNTLSTDVPANAEGEAAYNYRIENVPPGEYTMTIAPPAGSNLQTDDPVKIKVESGQLYPQSTLLLAQGIQKPRALAQNELQPGETAGYINDRGERVVYRQGSGFDATDAMLLYLLWRNPGGWGYGYPPVIVNSPGSSSTGSNYRVADPPTRTRSGQTVTQQRTPGQGSTRPSSSTGSTGSAPGTTSSGSRDTDVAKPSTGSSGATTTNPSTSSGSSTTTKPSTSSGSSGSSTTTRPSISVPSQGSSRPSSSSSSRPSSSGSRSSGSSGGGRR